MTVRALAGLVAFNAFITAVGSGVLFAMRPYGSRRDALRLVGLAYVLGVAALSVVFTLLLVVGLPITFAAIVLTGAGIFAFGLAVGRRRRDREDVPASPAGRRFLSIPSAAVLGLIAVAVEAIFRKARLQGLIEFDGWDSWGPKVKELFWTGHLPPDFLAPLPGGSYPPGLPAVLSAALHSIGSADVVTVHVQYWFFSLGFLAAIVGLLATRVPPLVLLPFVLLILVMPDIRSRSVDMYGDLPLGYLIVTGAVLIALWLDDRQGWQLGAAALVSAGAALTKREGVLLVGCVVVAGALASSDRLRFAWPRLGIVFASALAASLTWYVWLRSNALPGNGPSGGLHFLMDLDRGWASLRVVTKDLFNYDLRLVTGTMALAAVGLCLLAKAWRIAVFLGALLATCLFGSAVTIWSDPNISLDDVNLVSRLVGTVALAAAAITPLALGRAWVAMGLPGEHEGAPGARSRWTPTIATVIVAAAAVAYPAAVVAGGAPRFPTASDCVKPADRGPTLVVFGYEPSYPKAIELRDRVIAAGFASAQVSRDGCGRVRVFVAHVPARRVAEALVRRASASGLAATIEDDPNAPD